MPTAIATAPSGARQPQCVAQTPRLILPPTVPGHTLHAYTTSDPQNPGPGKPSQHTVRAELHANTNSQQLTSVPDGRACPNRLLNNARAFSRLGQLSSDCSGL